MSSQESDHSELAKLRRASVAPAAGALPVDPSRCRSAAKSGAPCRAGATASGYCFRHDPAISAETKRAASARGQKSLQQRLEREKAALAQQRAQVAAAAPGALLPPALGDVPDWSTPTKGRLFLQELAVKVAAGRIAPSTAKALKDLVDSSMKIVDLELDAELMRRLQGGGA